MTINWYGEGCFKITTGGLTILTDPIDSSSGLSAPRGKVDLVINTMMSALSSEGTKPEARKENEGAVIDGPGEYEVKGIFVAGWPLLKDSSPKYLKSVFRVEVEDLRLGFLGHISEFNEPEILEELDGIDILFIPAGGKPFIDEEAAAKLIRQINPKIVVASFFKTPGLKRQSADEKAFLKELGHKTEAAEEKLTIKQKDLTEKMRVVVLKP